MTRLCVFGLGEAGSAIAADLAGHGLEVHGFDPAPVTTPAGVVRFDDPVSAVAGAEAVLAITAAKDAGEAIHQALSSLPADCLYADLATSAPAVKRDLAAVAEGQGVRFVDVALMGIVAGRGLSTPALVSGPGAVAFSGLVTPLGMPVRVVGDEPGRAATHKLVRSVVMKGLAVLLAESMSAAHAAGIAESTWADLVRELSAADEGFLRRLLEGTAVHAGRRVEEMSAVSELLYDLGVEPVMSAATLAGLGRVGSLGIPPIPD